MPVGPHSTHCLLCCTAVDYDCCVTRRTMFVESRRWYCALLDTACIVCCLAKETSSAVAHMRDWQAAECLPMERTANENLPYMYSM